MRRTLHLSKQRHQPRKSIWRSRYLRLTIHRWGSPCRKRLSACTAQWRRRCNTAHQLRCICWYSPHLQKAWCKAPCRSHSTSLHADWGCCLRARHPCQDESASSHWSRPSKDYRGTYRWHNRPYRNRSCASQHRGKSKPVTEAPSGIIGLETSLALGITSLVKPGHLSMLELLEKMTINPARLYHMPYGTISEGATADFVIFDPDEKWVPCEYASKSSNTPFTGMELTGKVKYTVCGGNVIYSDK